MALGPALDPYVDTLLSNLLRMAGFTKKIVAQTSQATADVIIRNTSPQPRIVIPLFWTGLQDKTPQGRSGVIDHVKVYLDVHGSRAKTTVEALGLLESLEKCIRKALTDANAGVRQNARPAFWSFEALWKERGRIVLEAQDGALRKQLEKACPNQQDLPEVQPATPQAKKSSLAAAIAASRAKAKAIATAPPTLRHQATSTARTMSPPKRSLSPSLSTGSVSGRVTPTSPSLPSRSRVSSTHPRTRTVSSKMSTMSHSRTSSGESSNSASYPGHRVVPVPFSSPPRGSVLRQAIQTALPASPPPQPTGETLRTSDTRRSSEHEREQEQQSAFFGRSLYMPDPANGDLLTAISIPLPDDADSDLDMDESTPVSFSSPYEKYPPEPQPKSRTDSQSPTSNGHQPVDPSSGSVSPSVSLQQPIVEDALRARAEQAQSAAERLLELVEPEGLPVAQPPPSLLLNSATVSHAAKVPIPSLMAQRRTPSTPVNQSAAIRKQAAAFRDSPMQQGAPSLMTDMLRRTTARTDGAWWRKRMACKYHCHLLCFLRMNSSRSVQSAQSALCFKRNRCDYGAAGIHHSTRPGNWGCINAEETRDVLCCPSLHGRHLPLEFQSVDACKPIAFHFKRRHPSFA